MQPHPVLLGLVLLAAPVSLHADPGPQGLDPRPNVLFIAVDDLRPSIGAYGDPHAVTPNLDRLAASGTLFERAYCQQAVCSPSRISLLTGTRPDTSGIYDLQTHHRDRLPDVVTLPELFRKRGYETVGRGKIFHGKLDDPLAWDSAPSEGRPLAGTLYALPESRAVAPAELGAPAVRGPAWERADVPDTAYTDGILAEEAVGFLRGRRAGDRPFFLAVGFMKPHLPFTAPARYWDLHDPEVLWPPPAPAHPEGVPAWVSQPGWELRNAYTGIPRDTSLPIPVETQMIMRHGYYASTSFVDAQIGKVLDALEASGLAENTIVVLWGDHGFHAGELGTWCKHSNFEVAVRSPLLLRAPGRGRPGSRVGATVEFVDLYPTLAELAGLEAPSHLEGKSLAPFLDEPGRPADKPAFSQYPRGNVANGNPMMGYSVTDGRWRYTEWLRTDTGAIAFRELYDLVVDPHTTRNLAGLAEHSAEADRLSKLLDGAGSRIAAIRGRSEHHKADERVR